MTSKPMTSKRSTGKLNLDPALVAQARELARLAGQPVTELARTHTTVTG